VCVKTFATCRWPCTSGGRAVKILSEIGVFLAWETIFTEEVYPKSLLEDTETWKSFPLVCCK